MQKSKSLINLPLIAFLFLSGYICAQNFGTWTWMKGTNSSEGSVVQGTMGIPDPANTPGPMFDPVGFTDLQGRFWVYGGSMLGGNQPFQMWMFDPASNNWTWMSGSTQINAPAVYGTQGVSSPSNFPGTREGSCGWTDLEGNLWLFGTFHNGITKNDLWKYTIATNQWTWMKGSNVDDDQGSYGVLGVPDINNCPPSRGHSSAWTDLNGDLWLFGGFFPKGESVAYDDVWRYSIATNTWTWMGGSAGSNSIPPIHGVLGEPSSTNTPGGRWTDSQWRDSNGDFWLFSGATGTFATTFADIWKFSPSSLLWTWMGGANTPIFTDTFNLKCTENAGSPASVIYNSVCWTDACDRLWQFGGEGRDGVSVGYTNVTWFFDPLTEAFVWQGGSTAYLQQGEYGTQGVPSPLNYPPSIMGGAGFSDNAGNFWMFGGYRTPEFIGSGGESNTLWKFVPDSACSALNSTNPPQAIITANDPLPCSPLQVNFQSGGSAAAFDYQWDFGDPATTQDTATIVNPQYTYSAPGIYTISLIVSASNGCRSGSDTATFELDLSDALPLSSSITASACSSYEAPDGTVLTQSGVYPFTFTAANGCDSIVTLNLTINAAAVGELDIFSCGPYTADDGTVYSESSVFTTSLQAANGCDSLVTNTLTVYTLPDVDAGPAIVSIVAGDTVQLNASGAISYVWSPTEGLSCSICSAPLASPQQSTSYIVTGTDSLGCTKTDTVRVEVDFTCKEVFIPTIFSPNSKGPQANETFCVFSDCVEQFKLVIHNRWGERIFETEDINQCWDGTFKGQAAQSGVYAFNVYVRQLDGVVVNKTGTITLVQ